MDEEKRLMEEVANIQQRLKTLRREKITTRFTPEYFASLSKAINTRNSAYIVILQAQQDAKEYLLETGERPPGFSCKFAFCDDHSCGADGGEQCELEITYEDIRRLSKV